MTPEQFETRMRERFAGLDKNSDGIVDRAEIEAKMAERGARRGGGMGRGGDGMGRGGQRMLRRLGADESGTLTKEAFDARIKTAFARVDLNSDGKITDADLPPMMRGRGVLGGDAAGFGPGRGMGMRGRHGGRGGHGMAGGGFGGIHGLIQAAAKGKGDATLNDVLAVAETRFKWLDRNGDGKVDRADGEALRKEMADYRVQRFLHRFEATQSGQITREQFMKVATARFAERQAMRSHRGGEGRGWGRGRGRGGDSDMGRDGERDAPSAGGENDPGRDDTTAPRRN